jgi:hypothetical protein
MIRASYLGLGTCPRTRNAIQYERSPENGGTRDLSLKGGQWSGCPSVAWHANSPTNNGDREKSNAFPKSEYKLGNTIRNTRERVLNVRADLQNHSYTKIGKAILA